MMGAAENPSRTALVWFTPTLNEQLGTWQADVRIPRNAECGKWGIQQLSAKDKAGNTTLLKGNSDVLLGASFEVYTAGCDATPPTLEALNSSPSVVLSETENEVLVTATVRDKGGSGTASMTGWFEGPAPPGGQAPKNHFTCSRGGDTQVSWVCRVLVPRLAAKGIWKVGVIRLQDRSLNAREYTSADPVAAGRVFEVR